MKKNKIKIFTILDIFSMNMMTFKDVLLFLQKLNVIPPFT